jgi:DNA-binding NtrC family response regulator
MMEMTTQSRPILVVDDDDDVRSVVREILEEEGYPVFEAASTRNGLSIVRRQDVSLVLLDHLMPPGRRPPTVNAWHRGGKRPRVVIFSAISDPESVASAVGADGWLRKPFEIDDLLDVVRRHTHDA